MTEQFCRNGRKGRKESLVLNYVAKVGDQLEVVCFVWALSIPHCQKDKLIFLSPVRKLIDHREPLPHPPSGLCAILHSGLVVK